MADLKRIKKLKQIHELSCFSIKLCELNKELTLNLSDQTGFLFEAKDINW